MYTIYSKPNCPQCVQACKLLDYKNIKYKKIMLDVGQQKEEGQTYISVSTLKEMLPLAKYVPQIFFNDEHVGGLQELKGRV